MATRRKAKSAVAPIKALIQRLELTQEEGARFKTLTTDFLKKTKGLQVNDIISLSDKALYGLARELLQTETTPGKGPTGSQYWPVDDDFPRSSAYISDPTRFVKLVRDIMRNQRKNMASTRRKQRRQNHPTIEHPGMDMEPGPSRAPGANMYAGLGRGE